MGRLKEQISVERKDTLKKVCIIMALGFIFWSFSYIFFFSAKLAASLCLAWSVLSIVFFYLVDKYYSRAFTHFVIATVFLNFLITGTFGGGFSAAGNIHLVMIPFGAFLILGARDALIWGGLSILGILYFAGLLYLNIPLPVYLTLAQWNVMYQLCLLSITFISVTIAIVLKLDQVNKDQLLEESLRSSLELDKRSQLGQMSGQIAHEINNPLAIINGHISIIKRKFGFFSVPKNILSSIEEIEVSIKNIETVIKTLRRLSGRSLGEVPTEFILESIVEETLILCHQRFNRRGIEINIKDPNYLLKQKVVANRVIISQVLLCLLDNCFDAVISSNAKKWIEIEISENARQYFFRVKDSGLGVPEEFQRKLFSTLFTTKSNEDHVGLSLSQAKELMTHIKGDLKFIGNNPTTFEISFNKILT